MIQLFKVGSPERLVMLLVLFVFAQGPFLLWHDQPLIQEILRQRLGERLADGWRLYAQISDETGPVPAMLYALLSKAGLMHFKAQRILASVLLWQQAIWFNQMARRHQIVSDRNFLFAFFYLLFAHVSVDAISLSPALLSCSFLLGAFGVLFRILKDGTNPDDAMRMGLWLGFAFISFQPSLVFLLPFFLAALLFSGLRLNHYLIAIAATILPAFAVYVFCLYSGSKAEFLFCFLAPFRIQPLYSLLSFQQVLIPALIMTSLAVFGWIYSNQNSRVNFHRLGFNVFFFASIAGFLSIFLGSIRTGEGLLMLLIPAAGLMAQFNIHCRKKWLSEAIGLFLVALFMGGYYFSFSEAKRLGTDLLFSGEPPKGFSANFSGKSLLLLSNDFRYYTKNQPATRFFRHYMSNLKKDYSETYQGLIFWHQCLMEDPPELIYDPAGFIPELASRMPEFGRCYRMTFYPDLYQAVPGTTFGKQIQQKF